MRTAYLFVFTLSFLGCAKAPITSETSVVVSEYRRTCDQYARCACTFTLTDSGGASEEFDSTRLREADQTSIAMQCGLLLDGDKLRIIERKDKYGRSRHLRFSSGNEVLLEHAPVSAEEIREE